MNITLRKANALQSAIQEQIKTIEVKTNFTLNEFHDPQAELTTARNTLVTNDNRRGDLTMALYVIRAQVGDANSTSGVSAQLSKAAYIDKRLGQLKGLVESSAVEASAIINGKLEKIRNDRNENRGYGYRDTVETGVLTDAQIATYKADMATLKKEKQSINDKVLELNIRTEITLTDDVVKILQSEQLV